MKCRPPIDYDAIEPEHADPDARHVDKVANLLQPAVRDEMDAIVASPTELIAPVWGPRDIEIDLKSACIYVEATVRRSTNPIWERNRAAIKDRRPVCSPV